MDGEVLLGDGPPERGRLRAAHLVEPRHVARALATIVRIEVRLPMPANEHFYLPCLLVGVDSFFVNDGGQNLSLQGP